jgi:hypothetical protein
LLAALPWLLTSEASRAVKVIVIVLAAVGVAAFALILLLGYLRGRLGILDRLPARMRTRFIRAIIAEVSTVGDNFLASRRWLAWIFVLSASITVANMLMFAAILGGMGVALPLAASCALLVPAVIEITMLPISLAGWGLREGAAVVAFGALGLPPGQALAASIAFGLIVAAVSMLGGVLWLVDRHQMSQVSQDLREASGWRPPSP